MVRIYSDGNGDFVIQTTATDTDAFIIQRVRFFKRHNRQSRNEREILGERYETRTE